MGWNARSPGIVDVEEKLGLREVYGGLKFEERQFAVLFYWGWARCYLNYSEYSPPTPLSLCLFLSVLFICFLLWIFYFPGVNVIGTTFVPITKSWIHWFFYMTYFETNEYPWYYCPELGILGAFIVGGERPCSVSKPALCGNQSYSWWRKHYLPRKPAEHCKDLPEYFVETDYWPLLVWVTV